MADELGMLQEQAQEPQDQGTCDPQRVERTIHIIERGTREDFLDGELEVEETKAILDRIERAKEACRRGDLNACSVLTDLVNDLTKNQ